MIARIYIACLAAYNAGQLHGDWVEATSDADEMHEAAQVVLASSPQARAEEWVIHDHEGLPGIGELTSFDEIASIMELLEEYEDRGPGLVRALLDCHCGDLVVVREYLDDRGEGSAGSREDWAWDRFEAEVNALSSGPAWVSKSEAAARQSAVVRIMGFFDVEKYIREFEICGGMFIEAGGEVHAFS